MTPRFPCRCTIQSSQYHAEALCFGVGVTPEGKPFALVMHSNGELCVRYLDSVYTVRLG